MWYVFRSNFSFLDTAFLVLVGIACLVEPMFRNAAYIGNHGDTPRHKLPFADLFGGFVVMATGIMAIFLGYLELVHDWGNKMLTMFLLLFAQFS
jgi:hypothetical protein